jgi:hypothetical protein
MKKRIKAELVPCVPPWFTTPTKQMFGYVLPADAESYERMVEQLIHVIVRGNEQIPMETARAVLAAIGIVPLKKDRK